MSSGQTLGTGTLVYSSWLAMGAAGETVGRGRLAYSSWLTMRELGVRGGAACAYNDFALVKVRKADRAEVNPSLPVWGGPTGVVKGGAQRGEQVLSYGGSSLRGALTPTSPKVGVVTGSDGSGWSHGVLTLTPGTPGDSGSAVADAAGGALGTRSRPSPWRRFRGENGIGDLRRQLRFARQQSGLGGCVWSRATSPSGACSAEPRYRSGVERDEYVEAVLCAVEQVPPGRVTTYGAVAVAVGVGGPRQVGQVMAEQGGAVAWWRVVRADGTLPGSHVAEAMQAYRAEGTPLRASGRVDLGEAIFRVPVAGMAAGQGG